MSSNRISRHHSISLPAILVLCAWLCVQPAAAAGAPLSASDNTTALDRHSQSPRWQVHSRTGARFETRSPGSVTEEESVDDDVVLAEGVDVNSASAEELAAALPGIGPSKARNIIEWRETHGPFRSIEQLLEVSGIGPRTLENIRPFVRLGDALSDQQKQPIPAVDGGEAEVVMALSAIIHRAEQDRRRALQAAGDEPE